MEVETGNTSWKDTYFSCYEWGDSCNQILRYVKVLYGDLIVGKLEEYIDYDFEDLMRFMLDRLSKDEVLILEKNMRNYLESYWEFKIHQSFCNHNFFLLEDLIYNLLERVNKQDGFDSYKSNL